MCDLKKLIMRLADQAEAHRATSMIARKYGQDAVPTALGMMFSLYVTELNSTSDHTQGARQGVLVRQFGSAIGTWNSADLLGLAVRANSMKRLIAPAPDLSWKGNCDNYAVLVETWALLHGSFGRMATDITLWARSDNNAINEGKGGESISVPQKRDPPASAYMGVFTELSNMRVGGALTIHEIFILRAASLGIASRLHANLINKPDVLFKRFDASQQYVITEAVKTWITPKAGREQANDLSKDAIKKTTFSTPFKQVQEVAWVNGYVGELNSSTNRDEYDVAIDDGEEE